MTNKIIGVDEGIEMAQVMCPICGVRQFIAATVVAHMQTMGGAIFCQNGHKHGWPTSEGRLAAAHEKLAIAEADRDAEKLKRLRAEDQSKALKRKIARLTKRRVRQ